MFLNSIYPNVYNNRKMLVLYQEKEKQAALLCIRKIFFCEKKRSQEKDVIHLFNLYTYSIDRWQFSLIIIVYVLLINNNN